MADGGQREDCSDGENRTDRSILLLAIGELALPQVAVARSVALARGPGVTALALSAPPPPPVARREDAPAHRRSDGELSGVLLPARPCAPATTALPVADVIPPPVLTPAALAAALELPPPELPAWIRANPGAWLANLGDPLRPDPWAYRLLFPRVAGAVRGALEARLRCARSVMVVADPSDAVAAGLLIPVLELLAVAASSPVVLLAGAVELWSQAPAAELLRELESRHEPLVRLEPSGDATAMLELAATVEHRRREGSFRGHPLAYTHARAAVSRVDVGAAEWLQRMAMVAAALDCLPARPGLATAGGGRSAVSAAGVAEPELVLPAFVALALKPQTQLLRELSQAPGAAPVWSVAANAPAHARRKLDTLLAQRREQLLLHEARFAADGDEWLLGGKLSLRGGRRAPGFLPELNRRVLEAIAEQGCGFALRLLDTIKERFPANDGGARAALRARLQDLEQRRTTLAVILRSDSTGPTGLLGRKESSTPLERALADYARLTSELALLGEATDLVSAAHELLERVHDAIAALSQEVSQVLVSAERVSVAVAAAVAGTGAEPAVALPGSSASPGLPNTAGRELLARVLQPGALTRFASSPQSLLDELWAAARVAPSAEALLSGIAQPGQKLVATIAAMPPAWSREALPQRLWPATRARLAAPVERLAARVAAELAVSPEISLESGGDSLRLLVIEHGIPGIHSTRPAAPVESQATPPDPAGPEAAWAVLVRATLEAPDLATLAGAGVAISRADETVAPEMAEELAILRGLEPIILALAKSREVADSETRVHYLEEARSAVELWSRDAALGLIEPERTLGAGLVERLRAELARSLLGARGRADLKLNLRTRRLGLSGPSLSVEVEVRATGSGPAENVTVSLEPGSGYRVLGDGRCVLGRLPAGSSSVAGFTMRPPGPGRLELRFSARWDDLAASGNHEALVDGIDLHVVRSGFRRLESNPYIAGPPVRSERMFFGRGEVFAFVRDNLRGRHQNNVLLLHGNRRTGKSSLLYQLERGTHVQPFVPVYLDLQGLGRLTTASFFSALARKAANALTARGLVAPEPPSRESLGGEGSDAAIAFDRMNEFFEEIEASPYGAPPLLVMLDEFEILEDKAREGRIDREMFGWLRAKMQHSEKVAFLLAGTHRMSELDPDLWAPLLSLCLYRHVSFLSESETRELVTLPVEGELDFDDLAIEAILRLTGGHPYYAQLLCQILVARMNERASSNVVLLDDIREASARLLDAGGGQFSYEWSAPRQGASRVVLAALAEAADSAANWIGLDDLATRAGLAPEVAEAAARELVVRDLAVGSGGAFRVRVDLFRQWLRRERPTALARAGEIL